MTKAIVDSYKSFAVKRAHSEALYLSFFSIIVISIAGVVSSTVMGVLILLGAVTLSLDSEVRRTLLDPKRLGALGALLGLALLWQVLGAIIRQPPDPKAPMALASTLGIVMLLPVLAGAAHHDPEFRRDLFLILFSFGCIAALGSIGRHFWALSNAGELSFEKILQSRLVPIGRAEHQILGAGGLAACLFAGMALFGRTQARYKPVAAAGIAVIALTIVMTQSRGPILATTLALGATFFVCRLPNSAARMKAACSLVLVCYLAPMALVIAEPWLRDVICASGINICRPSYRQDIWSRVLEGIAERPLFGVGPNFRFSGGVINHPHNGLLGVIFFFGLPMGLLFMAILYAAVKQAVAASRSEVQMFALLGILFSTGMMATDLSNPFAFLNTHYLYLWLPIFVGSIPDALWAGRAATAEQILTSKDAPAHGLRHQAAGC